MGLKLQKFRPRQDLQRYIRFYYTVSFDEGTHEVKLDNHPQGTIDIVFVLQGGVEFGVSAGQSSKLKEIFIIGQQIKNFSFLFKPNVRVLGVTFSAEGFAKIFRMPMKELTATGVNAMDLMAKDDQFLLEQISEMPDDQSRILFLNDLFAEKIYRNDLPFDAVDEAIRRIRAQGGQPAISDLADEFNLNIRTLQRKFAQKIGVTPKTFARVMRFNYMMRILRQSPQIDWQDILYQSGYYDQMHFIKEFKKFTGQTPTQYVSHNQMLRDFFLKDQ